MKAAVLTGIKQIEIIDVPEPAPPSGTDVLLKVEMVGVCGSDVHYYAEGRIGTQGVTYPFRIGHEFSGTVLETGEDVSALKPGDRVAIDPALSCGSCDQCLAGRENTCRNIRFLGCPEELEGCLGERIVMPESCCIPIPENMSLGEGALVEPLSVGMYAVEHLSGIKPGQTVGILGCGPIGLSVLLPLVHKNGIDKVFVTDRIDSRHQLAAKHGACWSGNPDKTNIVEAVLAREPGGLDMVFECCGKQEALDQAAEILKPGGKLLIIGIPDVNRISFAMDRIRKKELCIQNVRRQNGFVKPAIDFIAAGNDAGFMITHTFPLEQASSAFNLVAGYDDGVIKAMVEVVV
jgi:L-iditol 2-dehydrogenase